MTSLCSGMPVNQSLYLLLCPIYNELLFAFGHSHVCVIQTGKERSVISCGLARQTRAPHSAFLLIGA